MPLHLHCDPTEPNSSWNWLERWSLFHFWEPVPQLNRARDSKSQTQKGNVKPRDPKHVERKVRMPIVNSGKVSSHPAPAYDKPIHILRKSSGHQEESGKEHHQSELERVKQNLRNIASFSTVVPNSLDSMAEKPKLSLGKVPSSKISEVPEKSVDKSIEKMIDPSVAVSKSSLQTKVDMLPNPLAMEEKIYLLQDEHVSIEQHPNENVEEVENMVTVEEEQNSKDDKTTKEHQRRQWRSFAEKHEYPENVSQHNETLPNYMQATKSAKAKLRGPGSPNFDRDGVGNGFGIRRHSLPLCSNTKIDSVSPEMQSVVQASGRGKSKDKKFQLSSTDTYGNIIGHIGCIIVTGW